MPNKAIYKDLLKIQYYFLFVIFVVFLFLNGLYNQGYHVHSDYSEIPSLIGITSLFISLAAGILALFQVRMIKEKKTSEFYVSLPIKKENTINAHYFAGITILISGYLAYSGAITYINSSQIKGGEIIHCGFFLMPLITGGFLMIAAYTFFFLIGILHKNLGGMILTISILLIFLGTGLVCADLESGSSNLGGIGLRILWNLTKPDEYVIMERFHGNEQLFFFDSLLIITAILFCFLFIQKVAAKEDISDRKGIFCVQFPIWVQGIMGAITGYAAAGVFLLGVTILLGFFDSTFGGISQEQLGTGATISSVLGTVVAVNRGIIKAIIKKERGI